MKESLTTSLLGTRLLFKEEELNYDPLLELLYPSHLKALAKGARIEPPSLDLAMDLFTRLPVD